MSTWLNPLHRVPKSLCLFAIIGLIGCKEVIIHDIDESKANSLLLLFERHDIRGEKERSGALWNISVANANRARALGLLEYHRIGHLGSAEVSSGGLLQSREEREQAILGRMAQRVEETLSRIPGVLEARVHLSSAAVEKRASFTTASGARPGKAGVFIAIEPTATLDEAKIRELVSGATGLEAGDIGCVLVQEASPDSFPREKQLLADTTQPTPLDPALSLRQVAPEVAPELPAPMATPSSGDSAPRKFVRRSASGNPFSRLVPGLLPVVGCALSGLLCCAAFWQMRRRQQARRQQLAQPRTRYNAQEAASYQWVAEQPRPDTRGGKIFGGQDVGSSGSFPNHM